MTQIAWKAGLIILLIAGGCPNSRAQSAPDRKCNDEFFLATYYKNDSLRGAPAFTRCERKIDFDWTARGPTGTRNAGSSRADAADIDQDGKSDGFATAISLGNAHFSARWMGRFQFGAGDYTFIAVADDGIKVWLDGELIINEWRSQGATEFRAKRNLTQGVHRVEVVYFQNTGGAEARLRWQR
jgi:hypothetical protein